MLGLMLPTGYRVRLPEGLALVNTVTVESYRGA
jgi:hypothetical protein